MTTTRFRFTRTALAEVTCPPDKTMIRVRDTLVPGLTLLVTSNGARTYYLYRKIAGRPVHLRIAAEAEATIEMARARAVELNGQIVAGRNPGQEKRAAREAATLGEMWTAYRRTVEKRERTMAEDLGLWRRYLEPWSSRRVQDITEEAVQKLYDRIAGGNMQREAKDAAGRTRPIKGGPSAANHTMALLSHMFTKCGRTFAVPGFKPTAEVEEKQETARARYLAAEELPAFWTALGRQSVLMQDLIKTAIFTAQRRNTLLTMRWEEVNLNFKTWTIPAAKMKSGKTHVVPLVPAAIEILERRKKAAAGVDGTPVKEGWVFASADSATGYVREPKKALQAIAKAAGIEPVTLHDLRRTTATWANSVGATEATIAAILNHKHKSVTGIYAKATADTMRIALVGGVAAILAAATPTTAAAPAAKKTGAA